MKVVYSPDHAQHDVESGLWVGSYIPTEETGERVERIRETMEAAGREIVSPVAHDDRVIELVHDPAMLAYMSTAHQRWVEWGYPVEPGTANVIPYAFPIEGFLGVLPPREPLSPGALAGVYAMDTMTPIGPGTWAAARAAVDVAETAAELAWSEGRSYALCRPPGHHAGRRFFGGSCYLNNAAVAAETFRSQGAATVGILDIDAHHGNGTQEIFYADPGIRYASLHVDPGAGWFPHFVGFAEETGTGAGTGATCNIPLAPGSGDAEWLGALARCIEWLLAGECEAVVVSLGVDAAVSDPESPLEVSESGYREAGRRISSVELPTAFVQEGGYDLRTIGALVAAVLDGFEEGGLSEG